MEIERSRGEQSPQIKTMYFDKDTTLQKIFITYNNEELKISARITKPQEIDSLDRLIYYDKYVKEEIERAEIFIKLLTEYRQELYKRSQQVTFATTFPILKFYRKWNYYEKKVYYYLSVVMRSSDKTIAEKIILTEKFNGKERAKAFKRFAELQKLHPGITIEQSTDKERWKK